MTGGGIVDHRNDWTYAVVIPRAAKCAHLSSTDLYSQLHAALADALAQQRIKTRLAPCPRKCSEPAVKPAGPDQCFVQPVMNDVLHPSGAKIAGAAMKRTRQGLLIQGSVDRGTLPDSFDEQHFTAAFTTELAETLKLAQQHPEDLRSLFDGNRIQEQKVRFATEAWLKRR